MSNPERLESAISEAHRVIAWPESTNADARHLELAYGVVTLFNQLDNARAAADVYRSAFERRHRHPRSVSRQLLTAGVRSIDNAVYDIVQMVRVLAGRG